MPVQREDSRREGCRQDDDARRKLRELRQSRKGTGNGAQTRWRLLGAKLRKLRKCLGCRKHCRRSTEKADVTLVAIEATSFGTGWRRKAPLYQSLGPGNRR